jgi:hypothetical protein
MQSRALSQFFLAEIVGLAMPADFPSEREEVFV